MAAAPFWNKTSETIDALIGHGADVNARDKDGDTPLHRAAGSRNDSPEIVDALIRHGAEINAKNENGRTPLHETVVARFNETNYYIVDALLDSGADAKIKDRDGKTAFDLLDEKILLRGTDTYIYRRLKALQEQ